MKNSIYIKISRVFLTLTLTMLATLWLLNNFGLQFYYTNEKIDTLKNAYHSIDSVIMHSINKDIKKNNNIKGTYNTIDSIGNAPNTFLRNKLNDTLKEYSDKYNITIALIDAETNKALISSERDGELLLKRFQSILFDDTVQSDIEKLVSTNEYTVLKQYIPEMDTSYIECIGYSHDNQTMIIMSTPISNLKENVRISNKFLAYIALILGIINCVSIYYFSKLITKPILNLSKLSEQMRNLDFDAKYLGDSNDELGVLGKNMNIMSESLKDAMGKLKEKNQQLKDDIKEKEKLDEMRKDFIANVSHELKTPIALIQGYAEGINEGLCSDIESQKYYLDVIIDEANKMNVMVKQLLSLSDIESDLSKLNLQTFNIVELVKGVVNSISILSSENNITLHFDSVDKIMIVADEFKIEEVVTNYVNNAIKHTYQNGDIFIKIVETEDTVKVIVENTGDNIPKEDIEFIWEKFYKVDKAHSRNYSGSGIGLSIVKAIILAHNGNYGVNNLQNGVEFWFELKKEKYIN